MVFGAAAALVVPRIAIAQDLLAEMTNVPVEVLRKISRAPCATTSDPALLQPVIDVAVKYKVLPRAFPAREVYLS